MKNVGTRIPPPEDFPPPIGPVAPGGDCTVCWGIGKEFGDIDTPSAIQVVFSGINKGPNWLPAYGEPLNGLFLIPQVVPVPCAYQKTAAQPTITLVFGVAGTGLRMDDSLTGAKYFFAAAGVCVLEFVNEENDHFVGGSAELTLPDTT